MTDLEGIELGILWVQSRRKANTLEGLSDKLHCAVLFCGFDQWACGLVGFDARPRAVFTTEGLPHERLERAFCRSQDFFLDLYLSEGYQVMLAIFSSAFSASLDEPRQFVFSMLTSLLVLLRVASH